MPVLNKEKHRQLNKELQSRISVLLSNFKMRQLQSNREGCRHGGHWINPESLCATIGNDCELRMAVDDFKTILVEIRRLK